MAFAKPIHGSVPGVLSREVAEEAVTKAASGLVCDVESGVQLKAAAFGLNSRVNAV